MTSLSHQRWLITIFDIKLLSLAPSNKCNYTLRTEITGSDKVSKISEEILFDNQCSNEQIHLDVTPQSTVIFTVLKNGFAGRKKGAGRYEASVSSLIEMQRSSGSCQLSGEELGLSFTLKDTLVQDALNEMIEQMKDVHFNEGETWLMFFSYFKIVKNVISSVSVLNSHVQQVWNVLLIIPDSIEAHLTRNSNINQLCERLKDIYKFIVDANRLPVFTITQTENLKLLFRQTLECVRFVKDRCGSSTASNFLKGPIIDNKIQEFQKSLGRLFDAIQRSLYIEVHIVVYNMLDLIHNFNLLGELPYTANAGFQAEKKCLPGTRVKLINKILDWVDTDTTQRVLVLSGQAGMGKSAVAHTIYENMKNDEKLATMFCFNRSDQNRRNSCFSTISRNLADDAMWLQNLVQFIGETEIRKSHDPTTQFNELIVKPSRSTTKPVVIIIDALDESGDRKSRRTLLDLLFKRSSELPQNYRLIITSRPEYDIEQKYENQELNVHCIRMADIDPNDTQNDIQKYISSELSDVAEILDRIFDTSWSSQLAEKAQGHFQWAYLACLYIVEYNHTVRLKTLLSKAAPASLFEMYHKILDDKQVSRKLYPITTLQASFEPMNEDLDVKAASALDEFLLIDANGLKVSIENQNLATKNAIWLYPLSRNRNIVGLKSFKSETVAFITFYNLTTQSVDISWINFAGNRQLYKALGSYDNYRQQTYTTHPWEIIVGGRSSVFLPTAGVEYYVFVGATDKPALVPLSGCGGLKSPLSVLATTVEFVNNSTNDASIFWINFAGGLNFYKTVKSGETYTQNTFVGHLWQVVASNGSKTCYASIDSDANVLI